MANVNLTAGTLRVERQEVETDNGPLETAPKAASIRTIHLPAPASEALAEHVAIAAGSSLPCARLFTRSDGRPLRTHHIHHAWGSARTAAGLPGRGCGAEGGYASDTHRGHDMIAEPVPILARIRLQLHKVEPLLGAW